jgi:hypothetical protein
MYGSDSIVPLSQALQPPLQAHVIDIVHTDVSSEVQVPNVDGDI